VRCTAAFRSFVTSEFSECPGIALAPGLSPLAGPSMKSLAWVWLASSQNAVYDGKEAERSDSLAATLEHSASKVGEGWEGFPLTDTSHRTDRVRFSVANYLSIRLKIQQISWPSSSTMLCSRPIHYGNEAPV